MNKALNTLKSIVKYMWLFTAIVSLGAMAREFWLANYKNALLFLLFTIIASYFFYSRHRQQKNNIN